MGKEDGATGSGVEESWFCAVHDGEFRQLMS